jgi:hypothetical protein
MRRLLLVSALLSVLAPAHAQNAGPEVPSLGLPLRVRATLERQAEHGCSQSFESVAATAQVVLEIDASGVARLTLDGVSIDNMGPSPGRYMAGDHEFTRLSERHRSVWTGRATANATTIELRFDRLESAEVRYTGWGSLPLPAPTVGPAAEGLSCAIAPTDVLPAEPTPGETATSLPLLSCHWTGAAAAPFPRYGADSLTLGSHAGVRDLTSETMFSYASGREVRLVP